MRVGFSFVVVEELVKAKDGPRRNLEVQAKTIGVHRSVPGLEQQRVGSSVDAGVGRPGHVVVRIAEAEAHHRLRQEGEIDIRHAARSVKGVGGIEHGDRWTRGWRVEGIDQEIVVKEILVATEAGQKVVPLVFLYPGAQYVVGIASPSEAVDGKIVEEQAAVILRLHGESFVEKPWAGLEVDQGVVHIIAAGHVGVAIADFGGRMNYVVPGGDAFLLRGRVLVGARRLRRE